MTIIAARMGKASHFRVVDLYLLPGLGADGRLFSRLDLSGHTPHRIDWPAMPEGSSLNEYAAALAGRVDASRAHALIGVSMGGMVAQEMALLTKPRHTVIISSWKGPQEMPMPLRLMRGTHPERLLTPAFMKRLLPVVRWQMGLENDDDTRLFDDFVSSTPLAQVRIQIAAVLGWEGPFALVPGLAHIHGDHDRLMPIGHIADPVVVRGGGHFMVYNRPTEIGELLRRIIGTGPSR